jgi:GT2 family glycosyltransferase/glycosyltransferase involved in cell wall biosynthesis
MTGLHMLKRCWQAMPLSDHNRWRITSILLEPILPFIRGSVVHSAYLREKEWQSKRIRPFHGDALPALPQQEKPDIIVWGIIDWRFRIQRPQHLSRGFAASGHRVFYVSTAFVNTGRPGFELERMDDAGRLFNVRFHLKGRPTVYAAPPTKDDLKRIRASLARLLAWTQSQEIVAIIQHPYWHELARKLPNSRFIYDCMDHHDGFGNTGAGIAALELSLLKEAEAIVTTSQSLRDIAAQHNPNIALIRNGAEYEFFATAPVAVFKDSQGRRVIGYYGAIAEWMDVNLVEKLARRFDDCLVLLVGADECGARQRLAPLANVLFTGEVKYAELPYYLYGIDVCLLPFRVTPLTLATNPVKVYEYLAAGKPVVAIDLPELTQFGGQVVIATTHEDFLASVEVALASPDAPDAIIARRAFAVRNSWHDRGAEFATVIAALPDPLVSVVVVTYNNLALTRACLDSLEQRTHYGNFEIIVVDNASADGTPEYLNAWAEISAGRHVILNVRNRGFSAANNQGLEKARGEYLVLLNNDTEVSQGWLRTLMNHLRLDHTLGMIGPVTNNIGNEARIRIRYADWHEMQRKARGHTLQHLGETFQIRTLAFFCVMIPRRVYAKVGPLDEAYGLGFFEDDDYCRRVEQAGWRIECAEDVFVHHHLSASFNKLGKGRKELLERNRKIYESKWGPWVPHKHRRESE